MILVSVGRSTMAVNPFFTFCGARVRSASLVAEIVVRILLVKLTCIV